MNTPSIDFVSQQQKKRSSLGLWPFVIVCMASLLAIRLIKVPYSISAAGAYLSLSCYAFALLGIAACFWLLRGGEFKLTTALLMCLANLFAWAPVAFLGLVAVTAVQYSSKQKFETALVESVKSKKPLDVQWVLFGGRNYIENPRQQFRQPMQIAVDGNDLVVVRLLLEHSKLAPFKERLQPNLFMVSAIKASPEMLELLIEYGGQREELERALAFAVMSGDVSSARMLMNKKVDLEMAFVRIQKSNGAKVDPMLHTAARGDVEMAKCLMDFGVEMKSTSSSANLLTTAISARQEKFALFAIEQGADVNTTNSQGLSPLHLAAHQRMLGLGQRLLEKQANVNAMTKIRGTKQSALDVAIQSGQTQFAQLLIAAGGKLADPQTVQRVLLQPPEGRSLLLQIKDFPNGQLAEMYALATAMQNQQFDYAEKLLLRGANPNVFTQRSSLPLHLAILHGKTRLVELMLKNKADLKQRGFNGRTALDLAKATSVKEIASLILNHAESQP